MKFYKSKAEPSEALEKKTIMALAEIGNLLVLSRQDYSEGSVLDVALSNGYLPLAPEIKVENDKIVFSEKLTQTGNPWSFGRIEVERNSELYPYRARGRARSLGILGDLANLPLVTNAIESPIKSLAGLRFKVEVQPSEPWFSEEDKKTAIKHYQYIAQVIHKWGDEGTANFVETMLREVPTYGFSLFELVSSVGSFRIDGAEVELEFPLVPSYIAPNSVEWWITEQEQIKAVLFQFYQSVDFSGGLGGFVTVPYEKLMHVTFRTANNGNPEGKAIHRPVFQECLMYRAFRQLQALAAELNALGDRVVILGEKTSEAGAAKVRAHLRSFVARMAPYLVLPSGCSYEWKSPNNSVPDFSNILESLRKDISLALDNSSELLGINGEGSYSLAAERSEEGRKTLQWIWRQLVARPIQAQVFKPFLKIAFPNDKNIFAPIFTIEDAQAQNVAAWLASVVQAQNANLLFDKTEIGKEVRQKLGLPVELSAEAAPSLLPAPPNKGA